MKFNTSDEDNMHDTNYINKHNDVNNDTRKLHLWAQHVERAVSVFLDVVSHAPHGSSVHESSFHLHTIHERLS